MQLGVRALHAHLLKLVDEREKHQLNKAADTSGLYGRGASSARDLAPHVSVLLQLCRVSRELAKKRASPAPQRRANAADAQDSPAPAANAAGGPIAQRRQPQLTDKCPSCKEPRSEHAGGRFCDKCVVCGKPWAEHPNGWCRRPNGQAPL